MTKLHLENNILESLPSSIGNLVQLKKLYLFNNQLEILPDEIGLLTNLELLSLHDNSLRVLNPHLAAKYFLKKKFLDVILKIKQKYLITEIGYS